MNKFDHLYEQHLTIKACSVLPGGEWTPRSSGWSLIQVERGMGYWLQSPSSTEIETGTVLMAVTARLGRIRASQLDGLSLVFFNVIPARLTGLITFGEMEFLNQAAARRELSSRVFPPQHPLGSRMKELCASQDRGGLFFRLTLLELFVQAFGKELDQTVVHQVKGDAKERLQSFLAETPPEALLKTNFRELARTLHCTPRHLNRIFGQAVGMSFRNKRAEIQLAHARDLLATSNSKIVNVALESGYKSLSLFNAMFARRFGTTPGRWRQKHALNGEREGLRDKPRRFAVS
jgi:AraC-like DNA-binding protein